MSKRSLQSLYVKKYKGLYEQMSNQDLADELDALADQLLALMIVSESTSVEIMYGRDATLKVMYEDHSLKIINRNRNNMI